MYGENSDSMLDNSFSESTMHEPETEILPFVEDASSSDSDEERFASYKKLKIADRFMNYLPRNMPDFVPRGRAEDMNRALIVYQPPSGINSHAALSEEPMNIDLIHQEIELD